MSERLPGINDDERDDARTAGCPSWGAAGRGSRLAGVGEQLLRRQSPAAALAARCSAISF
jgi:hypothetical protein